MRGLTKDEKRKTLDSFLDDEGPQLDIVDRSTLENWDCPFKGKSIEEGRAAPVGILAEAGNAVHDAFAEVILEWIRSGGSIEPQDLRMDTEFALRHSRPDIQPEALRGGRPSIWSWTKFISELLPENILRFDGGEKIGRGGQMAWDIPDLGIRYTSEIDLLFAGPSPVVLHEVDYKSGWRPWTESAVRDAFQFQSHAALVLQAYPAVECLSLEVWSTRANQRTYPVHFTRRQLPDFEARIRGMAELRRRHYADPPCIPWQEKCRTCPAAAICPVKTHPIGERPEDVLRQLIAVEAHADALKDHLKAHVDATKQDVRCGDVCFGRSKPPSGRKPNAVLYTVSTKEKSNGDSDSE